MLELTTALIIGLCTAAGTMLRSAPFKSVLTPRQKRITVAYCAGLTVLTVAFLTVIFHIWGLTAAFTYLRYGCIVYAAVQMLIDILVVRGRVREHLFVYGLVVGFHYLLLTVPNFVITFLPEVDSTTIIFTVLGVYLLLILLTYWPIRILVCNAVEPLLHLDSGGYWNTVSFIPIVLFATKFLSLGGEHDAGSIQQLISSALYFAVMVLTCLSITDDQEQMYKNHVMEEQLNSQKLYYAELRVRVDDARKNHHDFKHHLAAILHYADMDDKEGLRSYCNELMESTSGRGTIPYTGNPAADGVLYHYMQRAQQEQIDFRYSGSIHSCGIADTDLCALLGNALDNAVTACGTIPQGRSITLFSQSEKQMLSIVIRNTFDGKVEQSGGRLLSRKRENRPGVGVTSMKSICERYGGNMTVQWDDQCFTVMFLLPLTDKP